MRRADRLFQIVQLLRGRRVVTAAWLAERLEVSERTIYRDIQDLMKSGVPVLGEAGVGYTLQRGYELPPLTFNPEEIEALVLGARIVESWADRDLARAARSALTKVEAVLPSSLRDRIARTPLFAPGFFVPEEISFWLSPLRRAIDERRKVFFAYERGDGEQSQRTVRPLGLYFWGRSWSLAAWCELREAYRNFRPDRMTDLEVLADRFDDQEGVSLAGFLKAHDGSS